jgi:hypothetical protein
LTTRLSTYDCSATGSLRTRPLVVMAHETI